MTFARYRADAHRALEVARAAAAELHHNYVGTEHLLLALTIEDFGAATAALADCGVTRRAIKNQLAGAPLIEHDPLTDTDAEALAILGIDLDEVRRRVEETFGHFALDAPRACHHGTPLTDKSKSALQKTVQHARQLGQKRIGPEHLLLALLEDDSGLAVKLIRRLAWRQSSSASGHSQRSRRSDPGVGRGRLRDLHVAASSNDCQPDLREDGRTAAPTCELRIPLLTRPVRCHHGDRCHRLGPG